MNLKESYHAVADYNGMRFFLSRPGGVVESAALAHARDYIARKGNPKRGAKPRVLILKELEVIK